jgi:O-antigen/teichoic acid export membrane protein
MSQGSAAGDMSATEPSNAPFRRPAHPMRRAVRNAGWLLGGKGVGGIFSLVYLGLAARALGVDAFGEFALILSFGQAVASIAQFQTSEVMIRFGAPHLESNRNGHFVRLLSFGAMLDLLSAAGCVVLSLSLVAALGGVFGLDPDAQRRTAIFGASFLFALRGAPTGVLRLLDRYDVAALSETVLPASRLAAAVLCYFYAPSVDGFLIAWAAAELLTTAALWFAALRQLRRRDPRLASLTSEALAAPRENPDLWRFAWFTNLASSISFLWQHAPTLAVGWGAGADKAGGFRIAQQIAQSLSKPAVSLSRAVFPELTRLALADGGRAVAKFASKLSILSGAAGLIAVVLVAAAGPWLLTIVVGPDYAFAKDLLLLLTIAAAIDLWGFGQEPALLAIGRPGAVLVARAGMGLLFVALLIGLLVQFGPTGAAAAAIIGRLSYRIVTTLILKRAVRRRIDA